MKTRFMITITFLLLLMSTTPAGAQLGYVATPEKGKPETWVAHKTGPLRAMFPSRKSMEAATISPVKPRSYDGPGLENQPLRVMKNDDKDSGVILLGVDEYGETKLHIIGKFGKDGKPSFASAAGVPGTTWILPRDVWITVGDLRVKGFKIRVLKKTYDWKNPQSGKTEPVPDVIHVEIENLDSKAPGELVFRGEGSKDIKFGLSREVGVFVFSDLSDNDDRLIQRTGWKTIN